MALPCRYGNPGRFSSSLEEAVPEAVKATLAAGRFEELQNDPRALVDSTAADRLTPDLAAAGADDAAARELLAALGIALRIAVGDAGPCRAPL